MAVEAAVVGAAVVAAVFGAAVAVVVLAVEAAAIVEESEEEADTAGAVRVEAETAVAEADLRHFLPAAPAAGAGPAAGSGAGADLILEVVTVQG